ncbi:MAG: 4Fe-4S dicluster domain-containing protein [Holophagaceae bacterium]|nr:4Fe-4S dicluster domain-containing protein [Holophagaceae bacterium]
MLKKIRIVVASVVFALATLLFIDFSGTMHPRFVWLVKVQLVPAILAMNLVALVFLALLTFLHGRIYCSAICPLGIMQDVISWISGKRKGQNNRFSFSKAKPWLRHSVIGLFIVAMLSGISFVVSLLDPYSGFGRIASDLFSPLYRSGNNLLALIAESIDSYTFFSTDVWIKSWVTLSVALATLATVGLLAWFHGRTYCNTICPVGTLLGFVSKFSVFRPIVSTDKCTNCGICEKGCKASCIDSANKAIDLSRCVTCFNCIDNCKFGAIDYVPAPPGGQRDAQPATIEHGNSMTRRSAMTIAWGVAMARAMKAQQISLVNLDGGLADIQDKKVPDRKTQIVPPGAQSLDNMRRYCTACQLCVSSCPNGVLRPSSLLATLMQPEMSFERGYCRPECVECSMVCPSGAIQKITMAEKTAVSIGSVVWIKDNCVVKRDNVQCNSCERRCPTEAITLVTDPEADPESRAPLKIPSIDNEKCTGCGACEHYCPARPFSAIFVEGHHRHHSI